MKLTLVGLLLSTTALAQTIIERVGTTHVDQFGKVSVSLKLDSLQRSNQTTSSTSIETEDDPCEDPNRLYCQSDLSAKIEMATNIVTIKDSTGKIIAHKNIGATFETSNKEVIENENQCVSRYGTQGSVTGGIFFDSVTVKIKIKNKKMNLNLFRIYSAGKISYQNKSAQIQLTGQGLDRIHFSITNSKGVSSQNGAILLDDPNRLIEPEPETDPYCEAHPYDCD
jgi:hypothetical protein